MKTYFFSEYIKRYKVLELEYFDGSLTPPYPYAHMRVQVTDMAYDKVYLTIKDTTGKRLHGELKFSNGLKPFTSSSVAIILPDKEEPLMRFFSFNMPNEKLEVFILKHFQNFHKIPPEICVEPRQCTILSCTPPLREYIRGVVGLAKKLDKGVFRVRTLDMLGARVEVSADRDPHDKENIEVRIYLPWNKVVKATVKGILREGLEGVPMVEWQVWSYDRRVARYR
ncbi:hypothetical protein [Infirmifilum sp.]|uniref:hypothetical protein n=1 Tax=Infirmifilum sp. TaxID=2856575 RepID=UPI003D0EDCFD